MSRVAPTAKIPDDAPFPQSNYGNPSPATHNKYGAGPASIPPQNNYAQQPASIPPNTYIAPQYGTGPASIPPQNNRPASIPPQNGPASIPPNTYQAPGYGPSVSMPVVAAPRWGLIIFLLVVDLGLAGAGGFLLMKGLARPEPAPVEKIDPKPAPTKAASAAPVTAAPPQPGLAASVNAIAQTAPAPVAPPPAPEPAAQKKPVARTKGASPEDPYDAKSALPGEIELASARSKDDLAKCQTVEPGAPHGRIDISFSIEPDGSVTRVTAARDTTGSVTLAPCLISVIRRWAFASHPAKATDFLRPFIYN